MRIRGRGEKGNEGEVGMKRREGGVIVSSRLGAAGCVCLRVNAFVDFLCLHIFAGGTMPVSRQATQRSNPTEV